MAELTTFQLACGIAVLATVSFAGHAAAQDVDLDHVILGVPSLALGIETFASLTGVTPERGGRHPGRGTENALVSLGSGHYLELLAPIATAESAPALTAVPLNVVGWALHTRALPELISRVRAAGLLMQGPVPGSRQTPTGKLLQWRTAAPDGAGLELAPFVIEWSADSPHPSTTAPSGCRLVELRLAAPEPSTLQRYLGAAGYRGGVEQAATSAATLILDCPKGRVVFSSP